MQLLNDIAILDNTFSTRDCGDMGLSDWAFLLTVARLPTFPRACLGKIYTSGGEGFILL